MTVQQWLDSKTDLTLFWWHERWCFGPWCLEFSHAPASFCIHIRRCWNSKPPISEYGDLWRARFWLAPKKYLRTGWGTCVDLSDFMGETQCHKPTTGFYHQNGDDILGIAYGIGFTTWLGLIYWYWLSIGICWWHITPLATDCGFCWSRWLPLQLALILSYMEANYGDLTPHWIWRLETFEHSQILRTAIHDLPAFYTLWRSFL